MNKKILILVGNADSKKKLFSELVSKRIGEDVEVRLATFSDIVIEVFEGGTNVFVEGSDIREFNLVYFRRIDHSLFPLSGTLAICLDKLGIKYFDTRFREIGAAGNKFTSIAKLAVNGIPVPKTIHSPRERIIPEKERIISSLKFPLLAKDTTAQRNSGVFELKKDSDFEKLLNLRQKRSDGAAVQFLFQEHIDIEKEYRLLVLGDKVAVVHKKDKRNYENLVVDYETPGLETEFVDVDEIPEKIKEAAVKAAMCLNIEIAGVDACIEKNTGRVIILEVNRGPGFEYDTLKSPEINEVADFLKKSLE